MFVTFFITVHSVGGRGIVPEGAGRGAVRGKRDRPCYVSNFIRTRPETLVSKQGEGGSPLTVAANYFAMIQKPNWKLLQYRVDFSPPIEMTKVIFDGIIITFLTPEP